MEKSFRCGRLSDIELRNVGTKPKRVSDIYMEFRKARPFWQVFGRAEPARVDTEFEWHKRERRTRVEWLLEPVGKAEFHNVLFSGEYGRNNPNAPDDPKRFEGDVIAELGTEERKVRVRLGSDIMTDRSK